MPKVFVLQENGNHDLSPALQFGELHVINPPGDRPFSARFTRERIEQVIDQQWSPGDYFILAGDPLAIAIMGVALTDLWADGHDVQFLKFDKRQRGYIPITLRPADMNFAEDEE